VKRIALTLALLAGTVAPAAAEEERVERVERKHEILQHRTSGFWTSNRPAEHGAYRWRLLAIGAVLAAGTGYLLVRLLRRASADRK
jgi:hypothetical protein